MSTETTEKRKEKKEKEICVICYDTIKKRNSTITDCGHAFHSSCLLKCVSKKIEKCPICKKHLFRKEMKMIELYEKSKDELFNFETFCFIMNMIYDEKIEKCITDYKDYEDDEDNDSDSEEEEKLFSISLYTKSFKTKMNQILEDEL